MMQLSVFVLLSVLFISSDGAFTPSDNDCARVRHPMHLLTTEELQLYADGMHEIRANGKYQVIVNSHALHREMHRGSSFFFYHTYFVWEVETQIRALGEKYECFALPYYDWTIDAGRESDPWILNTVLGGRGDPDNLLCVTDDAWSQTNWNIRETCDHENEDAHIGCCLKRDLWPEEDLADALEVGEICSRDDFTPFSGGVAYTHQKVHWLFGRGDLCTKCAMATGYSPDDPIFMVLHSFAAYLRAVWASCHGYDNILPSELDQHPEAYEPGCSDDFNEGECGVVEFDDAYEWEELADMYWSVTSRMDVTPRSMWDFAAWDVQYSHGTFFEASGLSESEMCDAANVAQSAWFSEDAPLYGYVEGESAFEIWAAAQPDHEHGLVQPKQDGVVDSESVLSDMGSATSVESWVVSDMVVIGIGMMMVVIASSLVFSRGGSCRAEGLKDTCDETGYGTISMSA